MDLEVENWIDSLPYIDTQYAEPGMKEQVEKLIKNEMKTFQPRKDYLAHLPSPPTIFERNPLLKQEFERIARGERIPPIDTVRYQLNRPSTEHWNDISSWNTAVNNARSQLEHQHLRLMNLELMLKYGSNSWLQHNQQVQQTTEVLKNQLSTLKNQITETNRKRKLDQMNIGPKLQQLDEEFYGLCQQNIAIEQACHQIEKKIKEYHDRDFTNFKSS
eukprot:c4615_g1_i1.p1 GENE.c4615_g1_i1~~c4615_g1_i1.p1  ORF type:complete len:217 (+),score=77.58 c4615_g1_i1:30-680(+)